MRQIRYDMCLLFHSKDSKFVEKRRKQLQDYLRKIINIVNRSDKDLSMKPCRETLIRAIPFLSDEHFNSASAEFSAISNAAASGHQIPSNATNTRNLPIVNSQNSLGSSYGNNLTQLVRNNTSFLLNNADMAAAVPISTTPHQFSQNEPLYTGL
jgi:hypothetical protein